MKVEDYGVKSVHTIIVSKIKGLYQVGYHFGTKDDMVKLVKHKFGTRVSLDLVQGIEDVDKMTLDNVERYDVGNDYLLNTALLNDDVFLLNYLFDKNVFELGDDCKWERLATALDNEEVNKWFSDKRKMIG